MFSCYMFVINVITFALFGIDKWKAMSNQWRIKEATLLTCCALGGGVGGYIAMKTFHHKTRKEKFAYGVPALIVAWVLIIIIF